MKTKTLALILVAFILTLGAKSIAASSGVLVTKQPALTKETTETVDGKTKIELNAHQKLNEKVNRKSPDLENKQEIVIRKKIKKQIDDNEKGIWINIWNYPSDVEAFMKKMKDYDIDTLYLQINRSTTPVFKHPEKVDEILKEAHRKRIRVIGWSYCYLKDINTDAKKYIEPALYVSKDGESLDGMAADIEENTSEWAVKKYTDLIKAAIPEDYPKRAIVFAPKIKSKYPWKYIGENWDVLMPMTYWHGFKKRTLDDVHDFIEHTVTELKRLTGKENLLIHLITDGERTTAEEVKESLKAAKKFNINAGVSLYPEHLATQEMLEVFKRF